MTVLLEHVVALLDAMPQDQQDAYAALLLEELREHRTWERIFRDNPERVRELVEDALLELDERSPRPLSPADV